MRVKLQLVLCTDDDREATVTDIVTLQKDSQRIEHLGLTLAEAKQLLTAIQHSVLPLGQNPSAQAQGDDQSRARDHRGPTLAPLRWLLPMSLRGVRPAW